MLIMDLLINVDLFEVMVFDDVNYIIDYVVVVECVKEVGVLSVFELFEVLFKVIVDSFCVCFLI